MIKIPEVNNLKKERLPLIHYFTGFGHRHCCAFVMGLEKYVGTMEGASHLVVPQKQRHKSEAKRS